MSTLQLRYEDAIDDLNRKTKDLTKQLKKVKFKEDDIKTTNFTVHKNTIYRHSQRIDSGFIASQYLTVTFPYDKERIGEIIDKIGGSDAGANMGFSFGLSDAKRKSLRFQLIQMAVTDAREKASIIAEASGIQTQRHLQYPVFRTRKSSTGQILQIYGENGGCRPGGPGGSQRNRNL